MTMYFGVLALLLPLLAISLVIIVADGAMRLRARWSGSTTRHALKEIASMARLLVLTIAVAGIVMVLPLAVMRIVEGVKTGGAAAQIKLTTHTPIVVPAAASHATIAIALPDDIEAVAIPAPGKQWVSTAVAVGADGLPVVAALSTEGQLLTAKCRSRPCRDDAITVTRVDASSMRNIDIAIGSDGLPVIAFSIANPGRSNGTITVARCTDQSCSRLSMHPVGEGRFHALAIGQDGFPVLSFGRFDDATLATSVNVAKCWDVDCASIAALARVAPDKGGLTRSSIAIDHGGRPILAFIGPPHPGYAHDESLFFARCNDTSCAGVAVIELVVGSSTYTGTIPGQPGPLPTHVGQTGSRSGTAVIAVSADGLPVLAYSALDGGVTLRLLRCAEAACDGEIETHSLAPIENEASVNLVMHARIGPVFALIGKIGEGISDINLPAGVHPPYPEHMTTLDLLYGAASGAVRTRLGRIGVGQTLAMESHLTLRPDGLPVAVVFDAQRPAILLFEPALEQLPAFADARTAASPSTTE